MADSPVFFSTLSDDVAGVYVTMKQYQLAERNMLLGRYAEKFELPERNGKTLRVTRHKRIALPTTPLTEGTPPDSVAMSIEKVDVTVEQWGIVVLLTDVAQVTLTHPALQKAIDRTGLAMAEMLEREIAETLLAGTTVIYGGVVSARGSLAATDKLTTAVVIKATVGLRARGAAPQEGQLYSGVMSPQQEGDLESADTTFVGAANFANVRALQYGEVGIWQGVRWAVSNFLPVFQGVAAPTSGAATATKAQFTAQATGGTLATGNYQLKVVGRDANSDYERRISVQSGNIAVTGPTGSIDVATPTSTNYVYDLYLTAVGGTTAFLVAERVAGGTTHTIEAAPAGTEATAPANPASGVEVFVAWVFGKDAFGRVELNGMSMQSYITPAGASFSNPLAQGRKVGSKIMWKCFILDNAYFVRIETGSAFSAELPA